MALYADESDEDSTTPAQSRTSSLPPMSSDGESDHFPDSITVEKTGKFRFEEKECH